jgi:hypothetical protein
VRVPCAYESAKREDYRATLSSRDQGAEVGFAQPVLEDDLPKAF